MWAGEKRNQKERSNLNLQILKLKSPNPNPQSQHSAKDMGPVSLIGAKPILLFLISFFFLASASANNALTAYQALQQYGFPPGLLPKGVTGYELDSSTGKFKAYLDGSCTFTIDSYQLKYESTISGVITKDSLSSLSGVKVKILFLWINIITVTRRNDELQFSVGIASADFPVDNFYESPACGCGFDCLNIISNHTHPLSLRKAFLFSA